MGVTNFDNLPQNIVTSRLRESQQVLREQKGSTQVTSGNNLRYYTVDSPGQFAWSRRLPTSDVFWTYDEEFEITLTAKAQEYPLTDLAATVYTSNDGSSWFEAPALTDFADPNDKLIGYQVTEMRGVLVAPFLSKWNFTEHYSEPHRSPPQPIVFQSRNDSDNLWQFTEPGTIPSCQDLPILQMRDRPFNC